jgi:hypothetical protein
MNILFKNNKLKISSHFFYIIIFWNFYIKKVKQTAKSSLIL